ncbi:MAG TPA: hypothetical protein VI756_24330, partial [Blastocatellia bacterium]
PDPADQNEPAMAVDRVIDPFDKKSLDSLDRLASQSHWHVALIDRNQEVVDFFEFQNSYGLDESLDGILEACEGMSPGDFTLAVKEFTEDYSLDDLFED